MSVPLHQQMSVDAASAIAPDSSHSSSSSSSSCCVIHIKPLNFSPEQAAADTRTILSFMSTTTLLNSSPNSSPSLSSSSDAPLYICRICRSDESDARLLLSPCDCAGSLEHVHPACLLRWIESRPADDPLTNLETLSLASSSPTSSSSALSFLASAAPSRASSHVCELCQSPYRIAYTYSGNRPSCNTALLHLALDTLLLTLLTALATLLLLSLPADTSTLVWWFGVVSVSLLSVVTAGCVLRRYWYKNASVTLVAAADTTRPHQPSRNVKWVTDVKTDGAAVSEEYVKLECS